MKGFRKPFVSFSVFLSTGLLVLLLACLFSDEASALQQAGQKNIQKTQTPLLKTGQDISNELGDDGDLQKEKAWPGPRFPVPRFLDNGDGTITDKLTNLMWTKSTLPFPIKYSWTDALTVCNKFNFAGHNDWRLPCVSELMSLTIYPFRELPSGYPFSDIIPDLDELLNWTSTTGRQSLQAWFVQLTGGFVGDIGKTAIFWVWPVRVVK